MTKIYVYLLFLVTANLIFCAESTTALTSCPPSKKANIRTLLKFCNKPKDTRLDPTVKKPKANRAQFTFAHHAAHQERVNNKEVIKPSKKYSPSLNPNSFCQLEHCAWNAIDTENFRGIYNLLLYKRPTFSNPLGKPLFPSDYFMAKRLCQLQTTVISDDLLIQFFEQNLKGYSSEASEILINIFTKRSTACLEAIIKLQPGLIYIEFIHDLDCILKERSMPLNEIAEKLKILKTAGLNLDRYEKFHMLSWVRTPILSLALIKAGCNINVSDSNKYFPLFDSTNQFNIELMNALIAHGARLDAKNGPEQETALHVATHERALLLINAGASLRARNAAGKTCLQTLLEKPIENKDAIVLAFRKLIAEHCDTKINEQPGECHICNAVISYAKMHLSNCCHNFVCSKCTPPLKNCPYCMTAPLSLLAIPEESFGTSAATTTTATS